MTGTLPRPGSLKFRVAGVTFIDGYPGNLLRLREPADAAWVAGECLAAVLVRNQRNEYDPNAVEIHVPSVGMVGHMPAHLAARAAPHMDSGVTFAAEVVGVAFDDLHPDKPGLEVRVWREETRTEFLARQVAESADPALMAEILNGPPS